MVHGDGGSSHRWKGLIGVTPQATIGSGIGWTPSETDHEAQNPVRRRARGARHHRCRYAVAQEKLKIGFVYVGPVGDHGWTYQHDVARQALERQFGNRIETTFVEKVAEGPDAERVIEQLARTGHRLVFTTSFGFMDPTERVARRHPNVRFEHATGFKRSANLATYAGRFYEGRYILGQIAARMSKTGTVGYIGSFAIPEVISGINAFMLGAQSVRPDLKIKIVWVNSWYDPGKEADAAKALADQGADILAQHTDSPPPCRSPSSAASSPSARTAT